MAINSLFSHISSLLIFIVIVPPTLAHAKGFTTDLIHRESSLSPLSTPSLNQYERLRNSIQRSLTKTNRFTTTSASDPQAKVKSASGEYLMELSFGTPPVSQLSIVDTGSDLIWIQCQPCLECYKQEIPIFDPRKSSTYKVQSCESDACQALDKSQSSCTTKNTCVYTYRYGDSSHTSGAVASETITFKSEGNTRGISFPKVSFGCGNDNDGTFRNTGSGLVGLGAGPLSLVSQLDSSTNGKFSYCLIPYSEEGNYTSKINFGTNGEVSGPGVISTPIVHGNIETFYFINLEYFRVGKTKIPFPTSSKLNDDYGNDPISTPGNIIIDSGTTLTLLPSDVYFDLSSTVRDAINSETVDDPSGQLELCYQTKNGGLDLNIPNITAHFGSGSDLDGGDVVLKPINTFIQVAEDVVCFAMVPLGEQQIPILGNIAQIDFLIGYDNDGGKLSFKPMDCTKNASV
ncbi:aspartic proteinase CDR1-like [Silene latifolia]|uniref:aspartic proteinase CDR1-like n=1 Tax=Silene latifolia TaxID=37657 RepID=UPI003D77F336